MTASVFKNDQICIMIIHWLQVYLEANGTWSVLILSHDILFTHVNN